MERIRIKKNQAELDREAGELIVEAAKESIADHGRFTIALAGGSTPKSLYRLLADEHRDSIDWSRIQIFFTDERNVPATSDQSNFRMVEESLLAPLNIPDENIHRWRTELGPVEAASEYDAKLRRAGPLDLVVLGLGDDSHTASLFPNSPALAERERLATENWIEKLGDHRLTMTFPAINSAQAVVFLVSGKAKARAVATVLDGEFRPDDFPAQFVLPETGRLLWLLDEDAASELSGS